MDAVIRSGLGARFRESAGWASVGCFSLVLGVLFAPVAVVADEPTSFDTLE